MNDYRRGSIRRIVLCGSFFRKGLQSVMSKYVVKRLLYMIPVLLGVSFLVFTILSLTPGDPGSIILGITAKPEDIAALNAEFGG